MPKLSAFQNGQFAIKKSPTMIPSNCTANVSIAVSLIFMPHTTKIKAKPKSKTRIEKAH